MIANETRRCRTCGENFVVSADEIELFRRLAAEKGGEWCLPTRCTPCRATRRARKFYNPVVANARDEQLACVDCGEDFIFGGRDRDFFARRGWATPRRCRPCRSARRAG